MGTSISLWIERRLSSGQWEVVPRQPDRQPAWYRNVETDDEDGKQFAQKMLAELQKRSIPTGPQLTETLQRAASAGFAKEQFSWAMGKNYNLFAIVADHRNRRDGYEFTSQFISTPRGLPPDVSDAVLEDATRDYFDASARPTRAERVKALFQGGMVAPSWVTLEELLAVDWDAATHGEGVLGEDGDFVETLRDEIAVIGPPKDVRLVFFFDC